MTKLVYISESLLPSTRANAIQIGEMCSAFAKLVTDCHLVFPTRSATPSTTHFAMPPNVTLHPVPIQGRGAIIRLLTTSDGVCRALRPDVIYGRSLAAVLSSRGESLRGFEAHMIPERRLSRYGLTWQCLRFRRAVRVVCISEALRRRIIQMFPVLEPRCTVYHDCGSLAELRPAEPTRAEWAELGRRVVYCGSVSPGKGIETVLEVARLLPTREFSIVGGSADDVLQFTRRRIPPNVTCVGRVARETVPLLLRRHGVALLPNQRDMTPYGGGGSIGEYNSPLKLFEYWANGCVVVASDLPNLREVLSPESAEIVAPANLARWAEAIERCASFDHAIPKVRNGMHAVRTRFNWDARAAQILDWITA